jgi:hypothetical protein
LCDGSPAREVVVIGSTVATRQQAWQRDTTMSVRRIVVTVLGTAAICAQALAATPNERPMPADAAPTKIAASNSAHSSYIVRAPKLAAAVTAVRRVGGKVTHKLAIIDAVAAELTSAQSALLRADHRLILTPNRSATVAGSNGTVQPYVVEHTGANRLHASGITGRGVTIAFLDTGWWSQHATQTNAAGHNVVLQGYDAIGNTVGVGAPDDHYGHGTHILSIATNSAIAQDGTYIGIAPDAARVVVRAFDQNGAGTYANTIRGIDWILKNAAMYHIRVVNMSFGANEPTEQQVVVELLTQEPLGADRVQYLQHQRTHQALRGDRVTSAIGIDTVEVPAHRIQRLIQQRSHSAQRVRRRHPLLHRDIAEEAALIHIRSTHAVLPSLARVGRTLTYAWQFSTAC